MNKTMYLGAQFIQEILEKNGYPTLAVGGFVRDYLLNKEANDIDLATTATPEEMEQVFFDNHLITIPTGIKHGTITVMVTFGLPEHTTLEQYEVTTLRKDVSCDGRHAEVQFSKSFEEDAKRRDFTINALYMDLRTGQIYDFVGGYKDLEKRLIKFVGDPYQRIKEDYLRAVRFYRFLSKLNFNYDKKSRRAAAKCCKDGYLSFVSVERIRVELLKMLIGSGIKEVAKHRILYTIIPELLPTLNCTQNCKHHYGTVYNHTIDGLKYLCKRQDPILSLAFLLHDMGKPFTKTTDENGIDHFYGHHEEGARIAVRRVCHNLRLSSKDTKRIEFIIKNHMRLHLIKGKKAMRKFVNLCNEFSPTILDDMCDICVADHYGMREEYFYEGTDIVMEIKAVAEELDSVVHSPLDGKQIIDLLGLDPSPVIGKIKKHLICQIIDGKLDKSNYDEIVEETRKFYQEVKNES